MATFLLIFLWIACDFIFAGNAWLYFALSLPAKLGYTGWLLRDLARSAQPTSPAMPPPRRTLVQFLVPAFLAIFAASQLAGYTGATVEKSAAEPQIVYGVYFLLTLGLGLGKTHAGRGIRWILGHLENRPVRVLVLSFALGSVVGAFLLTLPFSLREISALNVVDILFVTVSAICVTGLSPVDIYTYFTPLGQLILMGVIQLGGLGVMTVVSIALLRSRSTLAEHAADGVQTTFSTFPQEARRIALEVTALTLCIELAGALLLWPHFKAAQTPHPFLDAAFHSVSAFCNAGFTNLPNFQNALYGHHAIGWIISALIIVGGLGFPLHLYWLRRLPLLGKYFSSTFSKISLHARMVVITSAILVLAGTAGLFVFSPSLPFSSRVFFAYFHSVSARTAGFNAFDLRAIPLPGTILVMAWMFIGASPCSTGGGIKTTTAATAWAAILSNIRGGPASFSGFKLLPTTLSRAFALLALAGGMQVLFIIALTAVDSGPSLHLVFESVSAFSTTGLSLGLTPRLSVAAKWVIMLTMFCGRVGPFAIGQFLLTRGTTDQIEPEEDPARRILLG